MNKIKKFADDHADGLTIAAVSVGFFSMFTVATYMTLRATAAEAALKERGRPINVTFTDEFIDQLYKKNHED